MSFDTPYYLFLLIFLLPLFLLTLQRKKKRQNGINFLATAAAPKERDEIINFLLFRIKLSDFFFFLFIIFVIFALSGPRWGTELRTDTRRGLDLIFAFDISQSMNVRDNMTGSEDSSRLERALSIAMELTYHLGDIRFGTAAGKSRGVLMIPLTYDSDIILNFLESLDSSFLSGSGTNLESLLDAGLGAFNDSMNRRQGIILFSDGEALQGSLDAALNRARSRGIIVSAVGLGSSRGGPVPVEISPLSPGGVLLDLEGFPVISSRQEAVLINTAARTSGLYVDGNANNAVSLLTDFFKPLAQEGPGNMIRENVERWQFFILAALICFGFSRFLALRRKNKPLVSAFLLIFCVFLSSCAPIQGKLLVMEGNYYHSQHRYAEAITSFLKALYFDDAAPYAEYGLGLSYSALDEKNAALERYSTAEEALTNSREHRELAYRINLNKGIIHFEEGDYSWAAEAFRKALEIDGRRVEAKRNLELSLLAHSFSSQNEPAPYVAAAEEGGQAYSALFDYLRIMEQEQWRNREWPLESNPQGLDY